MAILCFWQMTLCGTHSGELSKQSGAGPGSGSQGTRGTALGIVQHLCGDEPSCAAWPGPVLMLSQDSGFEVQGQKETHFCRFYQRGAWGGGGGLSESPRGAVQSCTAPT